MPNIPRSPNGQFSRQPLNQTPNSCLPASGPILDLLNVQVQRGGGNSSTSRDATDLANQIINDKDEEGDEQGENMDGRAVDGSIRTNNTTPTPDTPIPVWNYSLGNRA
ncbi:hypothetical protein KEM48_000248 [Puccinia striiformis f. sp. tritici PST-130]|nr:hypothetical protein KEM48_000248 [Puccinia striiformis f. sp. tritici PST-130]